MTGTESKEGPLEVMRELMRASDFPDSLPRYMRTHAGNRNQLLPLIMDIAFTCSKVPRFRSLLDDDKRTCAGICDVMRAFPDDREMQHYLLGAIIGLSSSNPTLMHRFGEAGACVRVCDASRMFTEDKDLQRDTIWAMSHLVAEHDGNRRRLADDGAMELVVGAMTRFPDDAMVQKLGCTLFMNVTNRTSDCDERLGEAGACEVVCQAMREFPQDTKLIPRACGAVRNLCNNHDNARRLRDADVCESLAAALSPPEAEEEEEMVEILQEACWAVASLAANDDASRRQLGEQGVCEKVCSVMRRFRCNRDIQVRGRDIT